MKKQTILFILIMFQFSQITAWAGRAFAADLGGPKIVIIEFHGLNNKIIENNLTSLPHFRELIRGKDGRQNYIYLSNVFTTIPAASVPACTSMYTGLHPQNTGVVSTIWFDRRSTKVRTMISYGQQRINNILTQNKVKTLFEYLGAAGKTSLNTMLMIDKGANWSIKTGLFFWGNASAVAILKNRNWFPDTVVAACLKPEFKLPGPSRDHRHSEAVVMPGACTKEIYLKNRHTGNWLHPPRLLADVKPAMDLLMDDDTLQDCVNALVIRQYPGERDEGLVENGAWWGFDWQSYQNGPRSDSTFLTALLPLKTGFRHFELQDYVSEGLTRQYTRETTPDIKLINKKGVYFEVDFTKYGHHGSYYPEDTVLSFWIAGPGLNAIIPRRHTIASATSTLDLIPMVAYLLDIEQPAGIDGRNPLDGLKP